MPTREEIDLQLLRFLHDAKEREKREDDGVRTAIVNLTSQVQLVSQKLDATGALINERMAGLAARVDKLERDADDTGSINVQELRERAKFWPEILRAVAIGVLSMVIGGGIMFAVTHGASAETAHAAAAH